MSQIVDGKEVTNEEWLAIVEERKAAEKADIKNAPTSPAPPPIDPPPPPPQDN